MGRAGIPIAGGGIDAGQRLFVAEQQRLVRGVEFGLADLRRGVGGQAAGRHEIESFGQAPGEVLVTVAQGAVGDEAEIPALHLMEIGIAALGEGAQQIEGRGGLAIDLHQTLGIGLARGGLEFHAVDHIAAIGRQRHVADRLGIGGARLGELAGEPAHFPPRTFRAEGQNDGHLQQNAEGIADIIGVKFREALGAIAALQEKRLALAGIGQFGPEIARLSGENQRRRVTQARFGLLQKRRIGPVRLLQDRQLAPPVRAPISSHVMPPQASKFNLGAGYTPLSQVSPPIR